PLRINVLHSASNSKVVADILFVHGLNGTSIDTWYHAESRTHWPSELLPQDIQDCRILSCGYDARVASLTDAVSHSRLSEHADTLLGHLVGLRRDTNSVRFLSQVHTDTSLRGVEQLTCGIIFLGTPHQGSALADMASIFARIISTIAKRHVTATNLQVLRTNSEATKDVEDWFYKWLRHRGTRDRRVHVASFYEELP
ncbi:hypothetical protein BR93DRAFT_866616, partial [Coniochaeta sp. PMI_546]